jgi:hypothetical protein
MVQIQTIFIRMPNDIYEKLHRFEKDIVLEQAFFEPKDWANSLDEQLKLLQNKYIVGAKIDPKYLEKMINKPLLKGFVRVAVPKLSFLAKLNNVNDPYNEIGVLIESVCDLLEKQREGKFTHYRKGQLNQIYIRCIKEIALKRKLMEDKIPGDILILDVSIGGAYAGWTPRRAREDIMNRDDLAALFSVDLAWIILLNPNRFQHCDNLSVDSVAEEYFSEDRAWECVLFFYYRGRKLEFGYRWGRRAYFDSGAAIAVIN